MPHTREKHGSTRLLIVVNIPEFLLSHRLSVAVAALNAGYEVHVATAPGYAVTEIEAAGLAHHPLSLSRSGVHPIREMRAFVELFCLMRRLRPDVVHLVTIKPVLYGGIVARFTRVPGMVAAVSGLGFVFTASGLKANLMRRAVGVLYRLALGGKNLRVIFQNTDDRDALMQQRAVTQDKVVMIRGSGVDLSTHPALPEPDGIPVVTFVGRLLRDKGIREFAEAAHLLKKQGVDARFWLVGDLDPDNPTSITQAELNVWRREDGVELLGFRKDVARLFANSNLVVLPSYREGLPKVLIEAAACGRAVVTTDVPGCRDAIVPGETGLLVPVRDAAALAAAIRKLLEDPELRKRMGRAGRALAEREFDIKDIVDAHLAVYRQLEHHT